MSILDQEDEVQFSEPILAQKGVRCGITNVEANDWEIKNKESWTDEQKALMQDYVGKKTKAVKLTVQISDDTVKTEHEGAMPRLTIEHYFNLEKHPYPDKKTGGVSFMGRQVLYQLEEAFGFDPVFKAGGEIVEPHVTKSGKKVAPKVDGVTRAVNPDFYRAYFNSNDEPIASEWTGKTVYCDITVEKNEQFGDRNAIARFVKAPQE